jgi:ubiquinol-cytochrome c reductase cytochrome c subunit
VLNGPEHQAKQSAACRSAAGETQHANDAANSVERPQLAAVRIVFVVAALLFMIFPARAQQSSDAAPSGNAQKGKTLFMSDGCYECHGRQGQGATQTGAVRIGPPMLSFEGFQSYVRAPKNQMPPYTSKALPEQDLADIYAYLRSIPMPPKGKDIPLLNK